jgi:hypothetical protein
MFVAAYGMMPEQQAQMIQSGNISTANWGGALGNVARAGASAYGMRKARKKMDKLSEREEVARKGARDVAMHHRSRQNKMLSDLIRAQQAGTKPQGTAPPPTAPTPTLEPIIPQGKRKQVPMIGGQTQKQQTGAEMSMQMQGNRGTMENPAINAYESFMQMPAQGTLPEYKGPEWQREKQREMAERMRRRQLWPFGGGG